MNVDARYIIGDSLTVLRTLPDASVDLVLTSPPFLALRSYLPADHPDKHREIGSEASPGEFIDTLLDIVEECRRVLAPHGSICFELGDTYSGSGGAGGDYNENGLREGQAKFDGSGRRNRPADVAAGILPPQRRPGPEGRDRMPGWPLDKSLCLVPESFRWALAYGRNPFTGRETPPWRVRNSVTWCRPNPQVGALGDKFRPATSDMVIACKSKDRYFDLDAVRSEPTQDPASYTGNGYTKGNPAGNRASTPMAGNPNGAPPLDYWVIPTEGFRGAHYAVWPQALLTRPILAMCPPKVCVTCGKPSERIVEQVKDRKPRLNGGGGFGRMADDTTTTTTTTLGWSDCGHGDNWRPGIVLDPFAGSGTTLAVAFGHGRSSIGIDLDPRNAVLARERVGMWLEVAHPDRR